MSQPLWWYTIRASGLVAWVLLLGAVGWGLVLSIRPIRRPRPAWALDLHRFLGGLAFVFIAAHLVGLLFDTFVGFSVADLFVPMASHWRPGAVALGVVAAYLAVAVEVTSLLMRRLPRRVWHSVHLLSLVALVLVTVHAFTAGADAGSPVVVVLAAASTAVVGGLALLRVGSVVRARRGRTPPAVALAPRPLSPADVPVAWKAPATKPAAPRPTATAPPPPRDPTPGPGGDPDRDRDYDPVRDPLFIPRTARSATGAPSPAGNPAPTRASLPSEEAPRPRVHQ